MFSDRQEGSQPQGQQQDSPHWALLRDLARFQAKLLVDALRDILMSPLSILAVIAGTLVERTEPQALFRRVMVFGQLTERWINLFDQSSRNADGAEPGIDELFAILEQRVVAQYHRGGATASAKHAIDRSLAGLHRGLDRLKGQAPEGEEDV